MVQPPTVVPRAPAKIIVRVDLTALLRGHPTADETCDILGIGPIAVSAVRDLMDHNPFIACVITDGERVGGVAHLGRGATRRQQTALEWLHPTCTVEGCHAAAHLQNDRREPWAHVHETGLDNLDRLCSHHHSLKTRDHWALVDGTGKRALVPPDDPRHPRHERRPRRAGPIEARAG